MDKLEALLTLTSARGIGSVRYERLLQYFENLNNILKASQGALERVPGIGPELAREIKQSALEKRGTQELKQSQKLGIKIITYKDSHYPENLRTIYDYPLILYIRGELKISDSHAVAVVGSRRATYYGKNQAERFSYELGIRNICVVSGLARGIDTHAHLGALRAKGRTIAVLGSGLNHIYPPENKELAKKIVDNGAVISELPLNTPPDSRNFPVRNRIISGLSLGVLVVEAPLKSGALITVDMALDQGREIFALPGKVDSPTAQGCHRLIKQGAKLVENIDDILEELPFIQNQATLNKTLPSRTSARLGHREETILNLLTKDEPRYIDEIIIESKLPPALVLATLLQMEVKKYVRQLPGKNFVRLV